MWAYMGVVTGMGCSVCVGRNMNAFVVGTGIWRSEDSGSVPVAAGMAVL